jgi:hypothetical protein
MIPHHGRAIFGCQADSKSAPSSAKLVQSQAKEKPKKAKQIAWLFFAEMSVFKGLR